MHSFEDLRSIPKPGVLVVEDVDDTRELLGEFLMRAGYHSIMASDGAEAMKRLEEIRPDVIVSDLMMDGMGGAEMVRRIDADPKIKAIPVILVTGSGRETALRQLGDYARRVRAILTKPVRLADLQLAIEAALAEKV